MGPLRDQWLIIYETGAGHLSMKSLTCGSFTLERATGLIPKKTEMASVDVAVIDHASVESNGSKSICFKGNRPGYATPLEAMSGRT